MMNSGREMMLAGGRGIRGDVGRRREVIRASSRATGRRRGATWFLAALAVAACDDSATEPGPRGSEGPSTLTVAAVDDWAYVDLAADATVVTPADPSSSTDWDMAFFVTSVMLNGGAAGSGEVNGTCLCDNASASDEQILALTPDSELAAFEAVDAAMIPVDDEDWTTEALVPSIDEWFSYDIETHVVSAAPENVWLVRCADSESVAKVHVVGIDGATQEHAGTVTIEYALKPAAEAPFEDVQTVELDASNGSVYFDLDSGDVTDASAWDIMIEGYTIRVNGGVSGGGDAAAARLEGSFESITDDTELPPSNAFSADAFGGVFAAHPWYRYNLQGNHQIWPTFDVYLIRTGSEVYKVQLINYYNDAGDPRHITFRYARIEG